MARSRTAPLSTRRRNRSEFARKFVTERIALFRKDTGVCLTPNARRRHAYMPALLMCMSFLELMSGVRKGNLRGDALKAIQSFRRAFLRDRCYAAPNLEILYIGFRHKIAHLGAPYPVFDTSNEIRLQAFGPKRVTWTIYARGHAGSGALLLEHHDQRYLVRTLTPWPVGYDHRLHIRLATLRNDLIAAALRYRALVGKPRWRAKFFRAMREYYRR